MTQHPAFTGAYTAMITPLSESGVDYAQLETFTEWQITKGIHGLVPCGTTGESPTLTPEEHKEVVAATVRATKGRVKVMAGTGSNATAEAIDFTRHAEEAGADAALVVTPYYNKPTQEGLFQHFKAIADATALPIFIYNIPGRSVINMTDATIARLAEQCPTIAGLKDATGDLARVATLRHLLGDRLQLFSGEDMTAVGFNAMGGQGVISVVSNIMPKETAAVQELTLRGDYAGARAAHAPLVPLISSMFIETNPVPVKYAAALMGKCTHHIRLPLVPPTDATQQAIRAALQDAKLI